MTGTLLGWVLNTVILCINMMYSTLAIYGRLCVIMVRITGMSGISVVSSLLKLDGVNAKGDAKVHIGKRVNVREEHARGAPKTCIRAIWRRNRCGHSNAGVVLAMFILFLRGAASAPVDSDKYSKEVTIIQAKITASFSWDSLLLITTLLVAITETAKAHRG
uniref:Secreted protein n=1 Tax=Globodera pallida TaxID=36090 RepID=A0A183CPH0_GLOPA